MVVFRKDDPPKEDHQEDFPAQHHGDHAKHHHDIPMRNLKRVQKKVSVLEATGLAELMVRSVNTIIQLRPRNAVVGLCRLLAEQCTPEELEEVGIILEEPTLGPTSALRPEQDRPEHHDSDSEGKDTAPTTPEGGSRPMTEGGPEQLVAIARHTLLRLFDGIYPGVFYYGEGGKQLLWRKDRSVSPLFEEDDAEPPRPAPLQQAPVPAPEQAPPPEQAPAAAPQEEDITGED